MENQSELLYGDGGEEGSTEGEEGSSDDEDPEGDDMTEDDGFNANDIAGSVNITYNCPPPSENGEQETPPNSGGEIGIDPLAQPQAQPAPQTAPQPEKPKSNVLPIVLASVLAGAGGASGAAMLGALLKGDKPPQQPVQSQPVDAGHPHDPQQSGVIGIDR